MVVGNETIPISPSSTPFSYTEAVTSGLHRVKSYSPPYNWYWLDLATADARVKAFVYNAPPLISLFFENAKLLESQQETLASAAAASTFVIILDRNHLGRNPLVLVRSSAGAKQCSPDRGTFTHSTLCLVQKIRAFLVSIKSEESCQGNFSLIHFPRKR